LDVSPSRPDNAAATGGSLKTERTMRPLSSLRKSLLALSSVFSIVAGLGVAVVTTAFSQSAYAETVQLVKDINQQRSSKVVRSLSNGRVAFHFIRSAATRPLSLRRSTASTTTEIDLSALGISLWVNDHRGAFITENFLYLPSTDPRIPSKMWQLNVDTLQPRPVSDPLLRYGDPLPVPIRDKVTGTTFLISKSLFSDERLNILDEQAATLKPIGEYVPDGIVEGSVDGSNAVLGDHILFDRRNGVWRLSKSGNNPVKLVNATDRGRNPIVAGTTLAYFSREAGPYECDLWRTDGTQRGTFRLTSIVAGAPGAANSHLEDDACNPETLVVDGNRALFKQVNFNERSIELWETSGSAATTRLIRRLQLVPVSKEVNPDPTLVDLRMVAESVWYKIHSRGDLHVAYVADDTLSSPRRVYSSSRSGVIDLIPIANHMIVQVATSTRNTRLVTITANGSVLDSVYAWGPWSNGSFYFGSCNTTLAGCNYGYGRLRSGTNVENLDYAGDIVSIGSQIVLPYKSPAPYRPQEFLLSHELTTGETEVRQQWEEVNSGSRRGEKVIAGRGNTAYICAAEDSGMWQSKTLARPAFWRTNGTANGTKKVTSRADPGISLNVMGQTECGALAVSGNKIYFIGKNRARGRELWRANLDGSNQKPFIDLVPGRASSNPQQIIGLRDGVVLTAVPSAGNPQYWPTQLIRAYSDGRRITLFEADFVSIVAHTDQRIFFRVYNADSRVASLWVTGGTVATTKKIGRFMKIVDAVDLNGRTYFATTKKSTDYGHEWRMFRLAPGSTRPKAISGWNPGELTQLAVLNSRIYMLQHIDVTLLPDRDQSEISRFNPSNGESTLIAGSRSFGSYVNFNSFAVLDNRIYFYLENKTSYGVIFDWQIWRSAGSPRDAVEIFRQPLPPRRIGGPRPATNNVVFTATPTSLLFFSPGQQFGTELWQLKP